MKIYDGSRGFYCFSCGAKGDVIDLVGKIFGCDNKQACIQISHDFNLNITTKKPNRKFFIQLQQKKILEERKKIQEKNKDLLFRFLYFRFHRLKPKEKFEELSDEFIRAMLELNKIELEV
jgi:DNA primase